MRHGSVVAKPEQRYGVVVGRFNDLVTKLLLEGAKGAFAAHGVAMSNVEVCIRVSECRSQQAEGALVLLLLSAQADTQAGWGLRQLANSRSAQLSCSRKALLCAPPPCWQVCWVPGSFELPVVAKAMAKSGKFDAVICIGVVVSLREAHICGQ